MERHEPLRFYGGPYAVFTPFVLFLMGVAWLGLSGAPDERGFWPILLTALSLGMVLSRARFRDAAESEHGEDHEANDANNANKNDERVPALRCTFHFLLRQKTTIR